MKFKTIHVWILTTILLMLTNFIHGVILALATSIILDQDRMIEELLKLNKRSKK